MNDQEKIKELRQKAGNALHRKSIFTSSNKEVAELVKIIDDLLMQQIDTDGKLAALQLENKNLKESNEQIIEKLAAKDQFQSILAHDLKTPFHTLLGYSYLLLKDYSKYDNKKRLSLIHTLYENIQQTHDLLENLLVWSRSQTGEIKFNPQNINITTMIKENIKLFQATSKAKDVSLDYQSNYDDLMAWADPEIVQTILRNLITNAIKFTPKNGIVTVGIDDVINGQVVICVCDNGIGIPIEIQEVLFKIEEAITTNGTENESGTGLGLMLCKEFTEKSGGNLWYTSEPGKGSSFYFSLQNKAG